MRYVVDFRTGTINSFSGEYFRGLSQYRYRVFVEMLGWELQCQADFEVDQFDRDDTVYVVAHNEHQKSSVWVAYCRPPGPICSEKSFPSF